MALDEEIFIVQIPAAIGLKHYKSQINIFQLDPLSFTHASCFLIEKP